MRNKTSIILGFCFALLLQTAYAQSWSGVIRLTWNSSLSVSPSIAADPGNGIHVVWSDYSPGHEEIFYKKSPGRGTTWLPAARLTWNSGNSYYTSLALDSGNGIHVVWQDETPGASEIYYRNRE
jgi:hypothetical protein